MALYNVLFLCTGNSARSIMAEAVLNHMGKPSFIAFSAGSHPSGIVRPEALKELTRAGISTAGLRSKSWDEFGRGDAPHMHFVFTVCDDAAKETCPVWPAHPITAHWGVPDPAAVQGDPSEIERAFHDAFFILERRINLFLALPLASIHRLALKTEVDRIGQAIDSRDTRGRPGKPRRVFVFTGPSSESARLTSFMARRNFEFGYCGIRKSRCSTVKP